MAMQRFADATDKAFSAGLNMDMASGPTSSICPRRCEPGAFPCSNRRGGPPHSCDEDPAGLFERPYIDESAIDRVLNAPQHQEAARKAVERSVVLLRNENALLPLDKSGKTIHSIAVIGPLADADVDLLSMWGALVKTGPTVSILEGVKNKVGPNIRVSYAHGRTSDGIFLRRSKTSYFPMKEQAAQSPEEIQQATAAAVEVAQRSDLAVLVLGEIGLMSAESASRAWLRLSGHQEELLQEVVRPASRGPGADQWSPLDISWAAANVQQFSKPGIRAAREVAELPIFSLVTRIQVDICR